MTTDLRAAVLGLTGAGLIGLWAAPALADAPCPGDELDECRVLIEINSTDGDIGFHVRFDAEGWRQARISDPDGNKIFEEQPSQTLRDQQLTENFFESEEPVCEVALAEDEDDEVLTLPEFLGRFPEGYYDFRVKLAGGEELAGATMLTHNIPAAPEITGFNTTTGVVTWQYGTDLGECTTVPMGFAVAPVGSIAGYEIAVEPEDEALSKFDYSIRVPIDEASVVQSHTVSASYLGSLPPGTELKIEVGAIEERPSDGSFGNQTFTEADGFATPEED
ncbi:MAG: hypothetical protein P8Y69_04675 [Gammaproteobacteria bacterium]